jgi:hypothetical protein
MIHLLTINDMTTNTEIIDKIPNDRLLYVICNSHAFTWHFFAMKIILTRLNLKLKMNDTPAVASESCEEIRTLLRRSANVPNAQLDLKQILSQ